MSVTIWTAGEVAAATGGVAHGDFAVDHVTFDSREVIGGELFVALRGAATDGHRFVAQARERGAAGLLVAEPVDGPHVLVTDAMAALEALGAAARARTDARIIGVTGSVGKTGVKTAIAAALERYARGAVHQSVKSYNNHTGVPLSLARMPTESRFGVFEMGMNHAGELAALTAQVRPHIAVVTWIAPVHLAFFADEAAIADAKAEIFGGLEPGGAAIVPFDNPHSDRLVGHARDYTDTVLTFGLGEGADVRAVEFAHLPDCTTATAELFGERLTFRIGQAGRHWLGNALAVLAAVYAAGGDLALAGLALADMTGLPGRGARFRVAAGDGEAVIIDESYNANPASMAAALAVLGEVTPERRGRRLAVLGAMGELGDGSAAFHAGLAPAIVAVGVQRAILVGDGMRPLADALRGGVRAELVEDASAAKQALDTLLAADDVLMVKGSNSIGLGGLVAALRAREGRRS